MLVEVLEDPVFYDGSQIEPLWAYKHYGILGDCVIVFRGGMDVAEERMKDLEDVRGKNKISGDDVLHLIVERFESPGNMLISYLLQRLLVMSAQAVLNVYGIETTRSGDDLFVADEKLTVSIATASIASEKMHLGINITTTGTPKGVAITSLTSLGIEPDESLSIGRDIADMFSREVLGILKDVVKTHGS
jgi:hypothetical protein